MKRPENKSVPLFSHLFGEYGPLVYSGADLVFTAGAGFVKVPLKMGAADGLNANYLFGVTVRKVDNNYFIPMTGISTPYGTALGIYLKGVTGKAGDFYNETTSEK